MDRMGSGNFHQQIYPKRMAKEFLQTGNYKRRNLKYGKQKNTYSKEKCVNLEFDS